MQKCLFVAITAIIMGVSFIPPNLVIPGFALAIIVGLIAERISR